MCRIVIFILALLASAPAKTVLGVEIPDSVSVDGMKLPLYASGSHRQFGFKIYVAGFYLNGAKLSAKQLIDLESPIAFRTYYAFMGIPKGMLVDGVRKHFRKSLENNPAYASGVGYAGDGKALPPDIEKFIAGYLRGISAGDMVEIRWRKEVGTELVFCGTVSATIPGIAFKKFLFGSWFDPRTWDEDFAKAILGGM